MSCCCCVEEEATGVVVGEEVNKEKNHWINAIRGAKTTIIRDTGFSDVDDDDDDAAP